MRYVLLIVAALALAACATLSEDACRSGDWGGIGLRDGQNGRSAAFIAEHAKACADFGIAPDPVAWEAGRQEGLKTYCTPRNAWEEGARGIILKDVCVNAAELRDDNRKGLRYHRITREIASLEADIRAINARLAALPDGDPERAALISERSAIRLEIISLRTDAMMARY